MTSLPNSSSEVDTGACLDIEASIQLTPRMDALGGQMDLDETSSVANHHIQDWTKDAGINGPVLTKAFEPLESGPATTVLMANSATVEQPQHKPQSALSSSATEERLQHMIAQGDQCNVRPGPIGTGIIAPTDLMDLASLSLEVDDAYGNGDDVIPSFSEGFKNFRRAGEPRGVRKSYAYTTTAGVVAQCRTLVRNHPRMRRRRRNKAADNDDGSAAMPEHSLETPASDAVPSRTI